MPEREDIDGKNSRDIVSLKEFVLRMLADHEKRFDLQTQGIRRDLDALVVSVRDAEYTAEKMLLASDKKADDALAKAETATNDRLSGMNEIRRAMNDREKAFAPVGEIARLD